MKPAYPLSVLRAITALNTGGAVLLIGEHHAAIVSPAMSVDHETLRRQEMLCNSPAVVALDAQRFDDLGFQVSASGHLPLGQSVDVDRDPFTAMSRAGRARTIAALGDPATLGSSLRRPGHVTPVRASPGTLLTRVGIVEGAVDLMLLAGQEPVALLTFALADDGAVSDPKALLASEGTGFAAHVELADVRTARLLDAEGQKGGDVESLFVDAMVRMPSGVSVITARGSEGEPVGLLVSSMTSYSSSPPSVVVSIAHTSRSHDTLIASEFFGVNVLAAAQEEQARVFSSSRADRFAGADWSWEADVPRLDHVQTFLRCRRTAHFSFGDHTLLIGSIVAGESRPVSPLVYVNRVFDRRLA